jgi:alkanesulfonate monooxygenase SsuD/methylene tetrahydromethanopterin reductase-like flavin-dependent oxidoreductase (luciferase family)
MARIVNVTLAPEAWARCSPEALFALVQAIESAGATSLVLEDPDATIGGDGDPWRWDPSTAVAALAGVTSTLGLVLPVFSSYSEPYNASRRIGSLDHLSGGRTGWLLDPCESAERSARTRSFSPDFGVHDPIGRAIELVEASRSLWDGWETGAFALDVPGNVLVDVDKLHASDYRGVHFRVAGPCNLRRPPSGNPPLFVRATDVDDLLIAVADVVITDSEALRTEIRGSAHRPITVLLSADADAAPPTSVDGLDLVVSDPSQIDPLFGALAELEPASSAASGLRAARALPSLRT